MTYAEALAHLRKLIDERGSYVSLKLATELREKYEQMLAADRKRVTRK
jgi:hypothetical protein